MRRLLSLLLCCCLWGCNKGDSINGRDYVISSVESNEPEEP